MLQESNIKAVKTDIEAKWSDIYRAYRIENERTVK